MVSLPLEILFMTKNPSLMNIVGHHKPKFWSKLDMNCYIKILKIIFRIFGHRLTKKKYTETFSLALSDYKAQPCYRLKQTILGSSPSLFCVKYTS